MKILMVLTSHDAAASTDTKVSPIPSSNCFSFKLLV